MASQVQPTLINLVPHLAHKLLQQETSSEQAPKQGLASEEVVARLGGQVRLLQVGGAALPDWLWYDLEKCGLPPLQGYGLTEASPVICSNRAGEQRPGTIGPAVRGVELKLDSAKQLWARGENVMCGYLGDAQATSERIRDGWLATGDLAEVDELGHYRILGRAEDVIVLSTGFKVSPELIEGHLSAIDWIARLLIIGQDQPYIVAAIWPSWNALPDRFFHSDCHSELTGKAFRLNVFRSELTELFRQRLADLPAFMHPREILVMEGAIDDPELVNSKGALRRQPVLARFRSQLAQAFSNEIQDSSVSNE